MRNPTRQKPNGGKQMTKDRNCTCSAVKGQECRHQSFDCKLREKGQKWSSAVAFLAPGGVWHLCKRTWKLLNSSALSTEQQQVNIIIIQTKHVYSSCVEDSTLLRRCHQRTQCLFNASQTMRLKQFSFRQVHLTQESFWKLDKHPPTTMTSVGQKPDRGQWKYNRLICFHLGNAWALKGWYAVNIMDFGVASEASFKQKLTCNHDYGTISS